MRDSSSSFSESNISVDHNIDRAGRSRGNITQVNDYHVLSMLGRGSFGAVYLVEKKLSSEKIEESLDDPNFSIFDGTHEIFAMKAMNPSKQKKRDLLGRLRNKADDNTDKEDPTILKEIAIMKLLHHPNLVSLKEVIRETEAPHAMFIIMDYIGKI